MCAGYESSIALTKSGNIYSFGRNSFGTLGLGNGYTKVTVPTLVSSISNVKIVKISCGLYHVLALDGITFVV